MVNSVHRYASLALYQITGYTWGVPTTYQIYRVLRNLSGIQDDQNVVLFFDFGLVVNLVEWYQARIVCGLPWVWIPVRSEFFALFFGRHPSGGHDSLKFCEDNLSSCCSQNPCQCRYHMLIERLAKKSTPLPARKGGEEVATGSWIFPHSALTV